MSNAFLKVPLPINEPVLSYAPGSKEREELQKELYGTTTNQRRERQERDAEFVAIKLLDFQDELLKLISTNQNNSGSTSAVRLAASLDWAHVVRTFVQKFHQIILFIFMGRVTKQVLHLVWITR